MTTKTAKHTPGALRAAKEIGSIFSEAFREKDLPACAEATDCAACVNVRAEIIDRETAAPAMLEALKTFRKYFGGKNADIDVVMMTIAEDQSTMQETQEKIEAAIRAAVGAQEENTP